jgi:serine/threonine protein kinase
VIDYGVYTHEGAQIGPFLVMELLHGEELADRLFREGVTLKEAVGLLTRLSAALAVAHARGVVHRDIKPSNLIFPAGEVERATVIDFSIARAVAQAGNLTASGSVVGTPAYMAPEQVCGSRDVGPAADLFSLGCVLYECLTGRLTFEGKRFLALRTKIVLWDPPPVRMLTPEVPAELDALVERMLAKKPAARPRDGAELVELLDALPPVERLSTIPQKRRTEPPTITSTTPARLVSIVVATSEDGLDAGVTPMTIDDDPGTLPTTLERAVRPHGAVLDVLQDGAVIATLTGAPTPRELANRAVRCALLLRESLPDALIGIATGDVSPDHEGALIDDVVQALGHDALARVFAELEPDASPGGRIRLDARTAALLESDFELVQVKDSYYLRG